jgi:hypothetical protein
VDRFQLFAEEWTLVDHSQQREVVRSPTAPRSVEPEPDPEPEPEPWAPVHTAADEEADDWRARHATMTPEERDAAELAEFQAALALHLEMEAEHGRFRKLRARFRELEEAAEAKERAGQDESSVSASPSSPASRRSRRTRRASAGRVNPRTPTADGGGGALASSSPLVRRRRQSAAAELPSPRAARSGGDDDGDDYDDDDDDEFGLVHHSQQLQQAQVYLSPVSERTEETEELTEESKQDDWNTNSGGVPSSSGSRVASTQILEGEEEEE